MRTLFVNMARAALAMSCLLYQSANAEDWTVKVTAQNSPAGAPIIEVESDGQEWTNIKSAAQQVKLSTEVKVSTGWRVMKVYLGFPNADFCRSPGSIEGCGTIYSGRTKHVKLDGRMNAFLTDRIGELDQQAIVDACNAGDHDPTQERDPFGSEVSLGIKAFILSRSESNDLWEGDAGRSETAYARAPIIVRCRAGPPQQQAGPKPISVDLRVKQKGETCPKDAEVTAYIDYDKPMTGRFRVVHNGKQGKIIEIKAREMSFAGKTFYRIERLERYKLDAGTHDFKIKVIGGGESKKETVTVNCPPFQPTSMWLTLNTENKPTCPKNVDVSVRVNGNAPGSVLTKIKNQAGVVMAIESIKVKREGNQYVGRLTKTFNMTAIDTMLIAVDANDSAHNSGWQPLKVECLDALSGKLTLQSLGATSCKGEALVAIHTDGSGELPYELECGPGKSWQRKVMALANQIGVDKVRFDVTNNEQVTCVLRTWIDGVLKPLDGVSKTFQCHKPTDAGASTDLVSETRPDPQMPDKPGKVVVDAPKPDESKPDKPSTAVVDPPRPTISCVNGVVRHGACECEATMKPVKAGKNAWRCVLDPKPEKPIVSEPKITCVKGRVKNGACTCDRTLKLVTTGRNAWACVKVVVDPPRNKDKTKFEAKTDKAKVGATTAPKKTAAPKLGNANKGKVGKGKGKTAKQGNGSSAVR